MSDNSLFLNVEHKTSENLTTEVFKYILISEEYSDCQKIIYNMIFPNDNNLDTKGLSFSVESQSNLGKSRPDCVIKNKHMIIAIENKFYAPFTNDDQIHRYCSELQKLNPDIKKYLVLLTLKDMKNYYENEIIKQFKQQEKPLAKNLDQIFKDRGMTYKTVLWDDLFVDFKSDDVIIRNLRSFIAKKYLKRTILDEEGLKMIKSDSIPLQLEILLNGVDRIKTQLRGVTNPSKLSFGRNFYGFMIKEAFGDVWFGYSVSAWLETKTPYALQIREKWIKEFDEKKILKAGFRKYDEIEYILPIEIDDNDIVNSSVNKISGAVTKLKQVMP